MLFHGLVSFVDIDPSDSYRLEVVILWFWPTSLHVDAFAFSLQTPTSRLKNRHKLFHRAGMCLEKASSMSKGQVLREEAMKEAIAQSTQRSTRQERTQTVWLGSRQVRSYRFHWQWPCRQKS